MRSLFTLTAQHQFMLGIIGAAFLDLSTGNAVQAAVLFKDNVLFNNNAPDLKNAVRSDFGFPVEVGDNFKLDASSDITGISWSGIYANTTSPSPAIKPFTDRFSIRIFSLLKDAKGIQTPVRDPLFTFNPDTINPKRSGQQIQDGLNRYDVYDYAFDFTASLAKPFTLGAGNYLLSIVNNSKTAGDNWFWATSNQDGNDFGRVQSGGDWFQDSNSVELSFAIAGKALPAPPTSSPAPSPSNAVPTPALLPGLIGFGLSVWRKRRSAITKRSSAIE